jgi:hypothetical protein
MRTAPFRAFPLVSRVTWRLSCATEPVDRHDGVRMARLGANLTGRPVYDVRSKGGEPFESEGTACSWWILEMQQHAQIRLQDSGISYRRW